MRMVDSRSIRVHPKQQLFRSQRQADKIAVRNTVLAKHHQIANAIHLRKDAARGAVPARPVTVALLAVTE